MQDPQQDRCVKVTRLVVESGIPVASDDDESLIGVPVFADLLFQSGCLCVVPLSSRGIIQSRSEFGSFQHGSALDHPRVEVMPLDFLPEVKAGVLPVVRNVLQISLDRRVCGKDAVIKLGLHELDLVRVAAIEVRVGELDKGKGTQRRAVILRASPRTGEGGTVGIEFRLAQLAPKG